LVREELFEAVQRAPAPQRISHETQHDSARVHVHRRRDVVIDQTHEAQLVGLGFDNGQMLHGVHGHLG
jgi:hypothetical protein